MQNLVAKYLLWLFLSVVLHSVIGQTSTPIVDLGYAQYRGSFNATSNATSFIGIRYAAPPTGPLRFQAPQYPEKEIGVQEANTPAPQCYQAPNGAASTNPFLTSGIGKRSVIPTTNSEDCLFLSVYTPGSSLQGDLPVLVWIHGGGYISGNGSAYYGPDILHESDNGLVVVVIQYRLGLFGFLPGAEVKQNGALNAGLLDQNFALQWVQQHITLFGGDPSKVTIWGQSAGAGAVLQQVVAHAGQTDPPLFRAAITSSTFLPSQYNYSDRIPELLYSEVVTQSNCSASDDTLSCLRGVDVNTLETINTDLSDEAFFGTYVFVPVVDGSFIVERPSETLNKGQHNGDFLLSFTNTYEGTDFVNATGPTSSNVTEYITELYPDLSLEQIQNASQIYMNTGGTPLSQVIGVMGESIFICPTYYMLKAFNGTSRKGEFAIPPGYHGQDVAYYWPTLSGPPPYNNTDFLIAFSQAFTSFTMLLDPNVKFDPANITPEWNLYSERQAEMLFNKTSTGQPVVQEFTTDSALILLVL